MGITMETHYIQNEGDIDEILLNNINEFNNVFELNKKNILQSNKKTIPGMDLTLLEANLTSFQIQKKNPSKSILRKNSEMYYLMCINIKSNKGECFSSLIDNLSEKDRIVIINGVVLKQFPILHSNRLTVLVRSKDNSSVILFKYRNLLEKSISEVQKYNDSSSLTTSKRSRDISPSTSSDGTGSPSFFTSQPESLILNQNVKVQKYNDSSSLTTSNKDTSLPKSKICSQKDIPPSSSSGSSCSPSFINSQPESLILNQDTRSNNFEPNILSQPTQCIGPCRLVHTVPNVFDTDEIVSGYCMKCNAFVPKCYLKLTPQSSNMEYKCPECSTIVQLTFFFIMNFLYGKNESQAIEVCCYGKKAESVVRKISKKKIKLEDCLSDQNNKQLVISSMKSLINNRTKVNIVVCFSPEDNKNLLLGIDMKYVVTTPIQ